MYQTIGYKMSYDVSHFRDLNPGLTLYERVTLPTELKWRIFLNFTIPCNSFMTCRKHFLDLYYFCSQVGESGMFSSTPFPNRVCIFANKMFLELLCGVFSAFSRLRVRGSTNFSALRANLFISK